MDVKVAGEGQQAQAIRIFGRARSAPAYAIRDFLTRSDVPFEWHPLHSDEEARMSAGADGLGDKRLPVCVFPDGTRLENPTIRQVTEKLGWYHDPSRAEYDLAIYGAGPAGLSAAVYGASEGLKTVVIEKWAIGGQAGTTSRIENYLGFPKGISGADLAERAREQACRFGAEFLLAREGVGGEWLPGQGGVGYLADGTKIIAKASVCATGVQYRRLNLPNEDEFLGAGLYYGAGASEASLCGDEHVIVVGGGNSAGQAAMHFSRYAKQVTVMIRGGCLKHTLSMYLVDRIQTAPNIDVRVHSEVVGLAGSGGLQEITLRNLETGSVETMATRWLFCCIGGAPRTEWAQDAGILRDEGGYLLTGPDLLTRGSPPESWPLERTPYFLETSRPGMFAAGDVRHGSIKRCASAVGDGAMAVAAVHQYLADG